MRKKHMMSLDLFTRRFIPDLRQEMDDYVASLGAPVEGIASGAGMEFVQPAPALPVEPPLAREVRGNLEGLGRHVGGNAKVRWTVRAIMHMLVLTAQMKRSGSLAIVLSQCVLLMLGPGAEQLAKDIINAVVPLPTIDYFRHARLKLDLFSVLFQRQLFVEWHFIRFLMFDASAQHGHEYMCTREDRCRWPRSEAFDSVARAKANSHMALESRICPISTLAKGHSGAEKKAINVAGIYEMETETWEEFDATREQVRGVTTDQGTERLVPDITVRVLPMYRNRYNALDPRAFLFPWVSHWVPTERL